MLRGVIVSPNPDLRQGLEARIAESGHVVVVRSFDRYLSTEELHRFHHAHSPQVVFVDVSTNPDMLATAAQVHRTLPGALPVALYPSCEADILIRLMNAGVREFLHPPFARDRYLESIARLQQALRELPVTRDSTDLVFAFLPAKAGAGSSTLAMNAALAMSRALEGKVLLADFDLHSGIARFLLKLTNPLSVVDAMEKAGELDESVWSELISPVGDMDVIASGRIRRSTGVEQGAVRRVIEYAARRYKAICLDLSGALEDFSTELLHECRRILLVLQPDLATVFLAREKLRFLRELELDDRVSVVLNRWHRDACLSIADIESVIGVPVQYSLSEDHRVVYQSLLSGMPIDPATELGKELSRLAIFLSEARTEKPEVTPKRRMVEYFSLLPARHSLFPGQR